MRVISEAEHNTLSEVLKPLSKKYWIPGFTEIDIFQEGYILGMELINKYDEGKGKLENFLRIALNNGLQNFVKSKTINVKPCGCGESSYCERCTYIQSKANVIMTKQFPIDSDFEETASVKECWADLLPLIDKKLPVSMRQDWRRILDNSHVVKSRKAEIFEEIREIVKEFEEESEEKEEAVIEYGWENYGGQSYFFIESDEHLAKLYMDEEAANIWLHTLLPPARQVYLRLRECGGISYEDILILAHSIDVTESWDV